MEILAANSSLANWSYAKKADIPKATQPVSPDSQRSDMALPDSTVGAMPPVQGKDRSEKDGGISARLDDAECQTCKNRKYQDGSNDPGVSYKSPTRIDPSQVANRVRGHEMEHVSHEQAKAKQEGRKVVSQTVSMHSAICPECGKTYISGGETRTVTKEQQALADKFRVGLPETLDEPQYLSMAV